MAKICKNCGSEIADGAFFCTNCGAPIPEEDPVKDFQENNPVPSPVEAEVKEAEDEKPAAGFTPAPEKIPEPEFAAESAGKPEADKKPAAAAASAAGITQRNIALCIILSFVTCGIYGIYWLYKLNDEVNILADEPNATSGGLVILFTLITCGIYGWYWCYKMGERIDKIKNNGDSSKVLFIVLAIFGLAIVNYAIMQDTINDSVGA